MSDTVLPLVVLWMLSQRGAGRGGARPELNPPDWPTTRSPPPPLPAFTPHVPDAAQPATPLPALHDGATAPKPKGARSQTSLPTVPGALNAAKTSVKHAARGALASATRKLNPFAHASHGPPSVVRTVYDLQSIINTRGGTLRRDGLYGPKTAAAWRALAQQSGLPPDISRVGPKTASVVIHTLEVLSVPPIP